MLTDLQKRLDDRQIKIKLPAPRANTLLIPVMTRYTARALKAVYQSNIETLVGKRIISGDIPPGSNLAIDYDGRALTANTEK